METDSRQSSENWTAKSNDAGLGNKMASETWNGLKTVEHELKITDVEGAVRTESPVIIEVDDEVDVDGVSFVNDLEAINLEIQDSLQQEKKTPKIEHDSEPESYSDVETVGSYNGPDPMGLLERIESTQEIDDEEEEEEEGSEIEDEGGTTISHRIGSVERWLIWMKRWPWLHHEESDGDFAYCLYCNVNINVNRDLKNVHQHNLSLYHQERENNYLAFKKSEKQISESNDEIKHEFGSNEYVASIKRRRVSEVESLNHFNWERWLQWHSWLQRIEPAGTIGLCKYCNVRMNVEFVYLRKRHETSKGHCEAKRLHENSSRKRKRSITPTETLVDNVPEPRNKSRKQTEDATVETAATDNGSSMETGDRSYWYEMLSNTTPPQCRCTLCNIRMSVTSFARHLKTKAHCANLSIRQKDEENNLDRGIWAQYADNHPWLIADPHDPTLAYCHLCSKRFIYGHSEIKRKIHENSDNHKAKMQLAAADVEKTTRGDEPETLTATDDNVTQNDPEQSEAQTEESEAEAEAEAEGSDEDYVEEDSTVSSQKSSVGRKELETKTSKAKRAKDKKVDEEKDKEEINNESVPAEDATDNIVDAPTTSNVMRKVIPRQVIKRVPTSMQGKVMAWRGRFPWISYKRNEQRKNYGYCKLCDTSVFMPSSKFASKHQRSARHIRLRLERKRGVIPSPSEAISMATATAAAMATGESKHKAAMAELQAKYNWLEPDATDENYCHCKLCYTRLPIKLFYLRQHDSSRKHAESLERNRCNSEVPTVAPTNEQPEQATSVHVAQDQDSDEALSVKSECSTEEQSMSKRSRKTMEMRRIIRALRDTMGKKIEERSQIDMARDMICSSFDIVKRIRTLERETDLRGLPSSSMQPQRGMIDSPSKPRDTIDLFFDSIAQTMKSLPADLAAEGKSKIMQIVCSLELRSMQRTASMSTSPKDLTEKSSLTNKNLNQDRMTFEEVINSVTDSETSSVIFEDQGNEIPSPLQTPANNNEIGHLSEITVTATQRTKRPSPSPPTPTPKTNATTATAPTILNGLGKDIPVNIRCILPSTVQVASKNPESVDQLRVVPINKLTNQNRNKVNGTNSTTTPINRNGQSQKTMSPSTVIATPPSSNSSSHSDMNNGTSPAVFHNIRVSNGSSSQVIRFQKSPMAQQQSTPQRQVAPPEKWQGRYSGGPKNHVGTNHALTPTQSLALAHAQLRSLQRPLTRNVPINKPSQP